MHVSPDAAARLRDLLDRLPDTTGGLRFEGYIGTCHGSSPVLKPVSAPDDDDQVVVVDGVRFFVPETNREVFDTASLTCDRSFMGRGLHLTWPHREGCDCQCK